jgi:uncharacterized protein involved in exopolysaccharide biosynthesis
LTLSERQIGPDIADMLVRHFARTVLVASVPVAAALLYNAAYGPSYTATVRVLVTPGAADAGTDGAPVVLADHGQTARNQAALLNDRGLMARFFPPLPAGVAVAEAGLLDRAVSEAGASARDAAVRLGLMAPASAREILADRMGGALQAQALGDTDVVALRFTWDDRAVASATLNRVLAGYQEAIAAAAQARGGLAQEQADLSRARAELAALDGPDAAQDRTGVAAAREKAAIQARLDAARATADGLRLDRALAQRKLDTVEQEYSSGGWVEGAAQPGATQDLAADFAALLKQRQDLAADPHASPRALRRLDAEIGEVREQNYAAMRRRARAQVDDLSDRLLVAEAAIARDEAGLRQGDAQGAADALLAATRQSRLARVADCQRAVAAAAARIDPVWQEVGGTRALSEASPPAAPDWPSPAFRLNAAVVLGMGLGFGSAVLAERRRRTFDRPADIGRHLGLEVLARLAELPAGHAP